MEGIGEPWSVCVPSCDVSEKMLSNCMCVLLQLYVSTDSPEEKAAIGGSFGSCSDPAILTDALQFAVSVSAFSSSPS